MTDRRTRPHHHQQDYIQESEQLQGPWDHISEDLTWTHHTDNIATTARQRYLLPLQAEEVKQEHQDTLQLLQMQHKQYPDLLHPRLVRQLQRPQP